MPAASNRYDEDNSLQSYRPSANVYGSGYVKSFQEEQEIAKAKALGSKKGLSVFKGLGTPATSQRWYVGRMYRKAFFPAQGCPDQYAKGRQDEGGFESLDEAISCFEKL